MVKTQWWIHVQNSTEEVQSVAATPPASPYSSQVSCGTTAGSFPFSALELLSPSTEDHVLDYALSFRRNKNEGQLVLLSDDITLKIKAMAEVTNYQLQCSFRLSSYSYYSSKDGCGTGWPEKRTARHESGPHFFGKSTSKHE